MPEGYYNFFTKFDDGNEFQKLGMDTDFLYVAPAEEELPDCMRPEMRAKWKRLWSRDCTDSFNADAAVIFFHRWCWNKHRKNNKGELGLFREHFKCKETLCVCAKTFCAIVSPQTSWKSRKKGLNNRVLEQSDDGPLEKYRCLLDEKMNTTSTNRSFIQTITLLHYTIKIREERLIFKQKNCREGQNPHWTPKV